MWHDSSFRRKLLWGCLVAAILSALYLLDPVSHRFMPKCPSKLITGYDCPGCGIQRAVHAALHGRFAEAWAYNRFLVYSIPYCLCVMLTEWVWRGERQKRWRKVFEGKVAIWTYIVLFFLWGIVRNVWPGI